MGLLVKNPALTKIHSAVTNLDETTRLGFLAQFHFKEAAGSGGEDVIRDIKRSHKESGSAAALQVGLASENERKQVHLAEMLQSLYALKEKGGFKNSADLQKVLEPIENTEKQLFEKVSAILFPNKIDKEVSASSSLSPELLKIAELQSELSEKKNSVHPQLAEYVYRLLKHGFTFRGGDFSSQFIKDEHLIFNAKKGAGDRDLSPANQDLYEAAFKVLTAAGVLQKAPHGEAHILNRNALSEGSGFGVLGALTRLARAK